jgi:hypothetical protein
MKRKQGHEERAEKNKDANSNLPPTEDKTDFTLKPPLKLKLPAPWRYKLGF